MKAGITLILILIAIAVTAKPDKKIPLEVIDPTAKKYDVHLESPFSDYRHVKDPVLGIRGQLTFQHNGKEIVIGPAVKWVATEE
jgi:hypothetical protein